MRRALAFLTPLGGAVPPDRRTLAWFPAAGAVVGAAVGATWWSAGNVWPPLVAAAVAVAADLALTGLLHADGLADAADGLLPQMPRERRLEVMAEPTVGAYGVVVVAAVLLLRWSAFASLAPDVLLVAGAWCGSRTVMAAAARALPYAREAGLATALLGGRWWPVAAYGTVLAVLLGGVAAGAGMLAAAAVVLLGHRRLGGFTGDVLGAAGVVGETAALLVAVAR